MLLTIHDANLQKVAFVDNTKQNTLNYYNDTWSRDMPTGASTFEFTVFKKAIQSDTASSKAYQHLNERAWVSFRHNGRTYLFNVMSVEENEQTIKCYCENLNLELINELVNPYKATRAMSFAEYCKEMALLNYAHLTIGINEISDQQRTIEWTTQETKLARLLNLAKQFNAEIEFDTQLKADSTLKNFTVNIYHEHDDTHQGVGRIRNDVVLKYGKNISSITRKVDKTGIFNTIRPTGKMPTVEVEESGERHLSSQRVKNADGSTTETIIRTASDGTKSKTIVHTKVTKLADKTRITTTTTTRSDGSIEQTVTTSKKGGPSNTEKRIIKPPKKKEKETELEKEVLTIENLGDWSIKNEKGELEFYQRGQQLYAALSMQLYPSTFTSATAEDQWTRRDFDFDTDEPNELRRLAYLKLKQHCYPAITYEVDGFVDVEIGDTVQIYDDGFSPTLIVKARVTEQKISFTNPASNKTTFANFKALENKLSDSIQQQLDRMIEEAKPYTIKLATDNGIAFKNGQGQTIVTPTLMKGNKVINSGWRWVVDGEIKATSSSYIVRASDINQKMVLTVSAWIDNKEVASEQLTLINTSDGTAGKTQYLHRAWANSEDGRDGFSTSSSANKRYFGTYTDFTEADSQDPTRYSWTALFDNVKGGNRNYFKNGRTQQINTGSSETYDMRTFIFDDFWKNPDRLKPNYVRVAFEISVSPALAIDTQVNVHFSATPWYKNQIVLKAGVTTPQSFEFTIDLSNASESYKTDNIFIRFGTAHGFPANQMVTLENAMLAVGTNFLGYVKAIEDVETDINSKADQGLTQVQLNALNEKAGIIQAELEAKASADTLDNWIKAYKDFIQSNETARVQAEKDLISASQRVSNIAKDLGELSDRWNFIDTYMSSSNEGLVIGKNDGSSSMLFSPNGRISMYSAGVEVMYISQGVIHIENGIFSKTIQIGRFREEQYHINPDMNVIRYVG
ncbi:phage tail protein [Streptococcus oralis]|uniref:phage tail protein n=1 Tax=Streptococcus oralis TaxID=1303 RepID=UPI0022843E28|nr:phage tail protein [Streptococcus oralis]MCY7079794.1 phage tail protein [Streptococcus oralis]